RVERTLGVGTGQPGAFQGNVDQIGAGARAQHTGVGPSQGGMGGGGTQQGTRAQGAATQGTQTLVQLNAPGLLEQIGTHMLVGAQAQGPGHQVPGTWQPVCQVAFGGGTQADRGLGPSNVGDVGVGQVGGVHQAGAFGERPGIGQHSCGRTSVGGQACDVLGGLFGDMHVQGQAAAV